MCGKDTDSARRVAEQAGDDRHTRDIVKSHGCGDGRPSNDHVRISKRPAHRRPGLGAIDPG